MIYEIIEELRSDNSRLFKESVLEKYKDNEIFKQVLYYTLSPRKQYHIKKIPKYSTDAIAFPPNGSLAAIFTLLKYLHGRVVTGNEAIKLLHETLTMLPEHDAKVLELIIGRDLKCGVNTSSVNKVFPGLIEETPYMRCSLLKDLKKDKIDWSKGLYSQEKLDGMFANIIIADKNEVLSRSGSPFPLEYFIDIVEDLQWKMTQDENLVFHGELVVYQGTTLLKREIGNGILNSLLKTGEFDKSQYSIHFVVWDVLDEQDFKVDKCSKTPYKVRFADLQNRLDGNFKNISLCPTTIVFSFEEAKAHYKKLALEGKEGTILKDPQSIWKDHTSKQMWKFKVEAEAELRVKGFTEGNGKNKNLFGSIEMQSEDGLLEVNISGFTDKEREEIHRNREDYIDCITTVVYNSIMKSEGKKASMFLPRFKEWRLDKTQANTLKEIEDIFESVLNDES